MPSINQYKFNVNYFNMPAKTKEISIRDL